MNRVLRQIVIQNIKRSGLISFLTDVATDYPILHDAVIYIRWMMNSKHITHKRDGKTITIVLEL